MAQPPKKPVTSTKAPKMTQQSIDAAAKMEADEMAGMRAMEKAEAAKKKDQPMVKKAKGGKVCKKACGGKVGKSSGKGKKK